MPADIYQPLVAAIVTGLVSSLGTIAALKVDIRWAHAKADAAHSRIDRHEELHHGSA